MAHPKGGYRTKDGKRVPGVTTVIGRFKDSGALLWWAFEQGKSAERGEINSLYDKRDQAADAGTLAHDLFEDFICGGTPCLPDDVDEQVGTLAWKGYENAKEWFEDTRITVTDTEMPLVSETYRFGGCPDAIGVDSRGRKVLLDWKTSNGIYLDYVIQLAAYGILLKEEFNFHAETYHIIRFSKEHADFEHRKFEDIEVFGQQFLRFLDCYDADKQMKKRVR